MCGWLVAATTPYVAVLQEGEELDDEDERGEPVPPAEPQPPSDGGVPHDELFVDWDEFDAVRAAHEDRLPAMTT
jgi:hypothetical protein